MVDKQSKKAIVIDVVIATLGRRNMRSWRGPEEKSPWYFSTRAKGEFRVFLFVFL